MDTTEHFKNPPTIYASTDDLRRAIEKGTTPNAGLCYFKLSPSEASPLRKVYAALAGMQGYADFLNFQY